MAKSRTVNIAVMIMIAAKIEAFKCSIAFAVALLKLDPSDHSGIKASPS
jgi:hypothetical protein